MNDEIQKDVESFLEGHHLDGPAESEDGMEKDAAGFMLGLGGAVALAALGSAAYGGYSWGQGGSEPSAPEYEDKELEGWKKLAPLAAAGVGAYALDQYMKGYDPKDEEDRINPWERSEKLKELAGEKSASVGAGMGKRGFIEGIENLGEGLLVTLPFGIGLAGGYFTGNAMDPDENDKRALMNKELATYYRDEADKARIRAAELLANQRA